MGFRPFPRASEMSFVYRRCDCEVTREWKKQLCLSGLLICVSSVSLDLISLCSHTFKISAIYFLEICTVYIKVHVYIKQSTFQYHFELFCFFYAEVETGLSTDDVRDPNNFKKKRPRPPPTRFHFCGDTMHYPAPLPNLDP